MTKVAKTEARKLMDNFAWEVREALKTSRGRRIDRMATWRYVKGTSTNVGAVWRASNGLHWADYDAQGNLVATGTDPFCRPTDDELTAWQAEAKVIASNAAKVDLSPPLYIRWGALPKGGKSRNHATGQPEKGISVYAARYNPFLDAYEYADTALAGAAITYLTVGAKAYLVTGREVGIGSDGEPLLAEDDVKILAELQPVKEGFKIVSEKGVKE